MSCVLLDGIPFIDSRRNGLLFVFAKKKNFEVENEGKIEGVKMRKI